MIKKIFFVTCVALAIAGTPQYLDHLAGTDDAGPDRPDDGAAQGTVLAVAPVQQANYATGARSASIPMDRTGHFVADFRFNGRPVRGVVDTGATFVALNESTAKSLGVHLAGRDFVHTVRTANGETKGAIVEIARVEIGTVSVSGVTAFVLRDEALSSTLVGMSFLSKLRSYKVSGQSLELTD